MLHCFKKYTDRSASRDAILIQKYRLRIKRLEILKREGELEITTAIYFE